MNESIGRCRHLHRGDFLRRGEERRVIAVTAVDDELVGNEHHWRVVGNVTMGTVGTVIAERLYVATLVEHHVKPAGLQPSVTLIVQAKFHELAQLTARHAEGTQGIGEG